MNEHELINEMSGWIGDAFDVDVELSPEKVQSFVDRHYEGGVEQFVRDQG